MHAATKSSGPDEYPKIGTRALIFLRHSVNLWLYHVGLFNVEKIRIHRADAEVVFDLLQLARGSIYESLPVLDTRFE